MKITLTNMILATVLTMITMCTTNAGLVSGPNGNLTISQIISSGGVSTNDSRVLTFTNSGNSFVGDGSGLTGISSATNSAYRLGFVTRNSGRLPSNNNPASTTWGQRRGYISSQWITNLQVAYPNFRAEEIGSGGNAGISAAIEYPSNTINQLLFNGATRGTITNASYVVSDLKTLSTPIPPGATFWIRTYYTNSAGILYYNYQTTYGTINVWEMTSEFGSAITDKTTSTGLIGSAGFYTYDAMAVIGYSTKPSVLIIGDSRDVGLDDRPDAPLQGIDRLIGKYYAIANLSQGGESAQSVVTLRKAFAAYATALVTDYGYNGNSTILTDMPAFAAGFNIPVYAETVTPSTTSSDAWATLSGQTRTGFYSAITNYNTKLRLGLVSGLSGYLDVAAVNESTPNSGLWSANGSTNWLTEDGVHGPYYERLANLLGDPFRTSYRTFDTMANLNNSPLNLTNSANQFTGTFNGNGAGLTGISGTLNPAQSNIINSALTNVAAFQPADSDLTNLANRIMVNIGSLSGTNGIVTLFHSDGSFSNFFGTTDFDRGNSAIAAKLTAVAGDTIYVSGNLLITNTLAKDGVDWVFDAVTVTATNCIVFNDGGSSMSFSVTGDGTFSTTNADGLFLSGGGTVFLSGVEIAANQTAQPNRACLRVSNGTQLYIRMSKAIRSQSYDVFLIDGGTNTLIDFQTDIVFAGDNPVEFTENPSTDLFSIVRGHFNSMFSTNTINNDSASGLILQISGDSWTCFSGNVNIPINFGTTNSFVFIGRTILATSTYPGTNFWVGDLNRANPLRAINNIQSLAGQFIGNGAGLTNLPVSALQGIFYTGQTNIGNLATSLLISIGHTMTSTNFTPNVSFLGGALAGAVTPSYSLLTTTNFTMSLSAGIAGGDNLTWSVIYSP